MTQTDIETAAVAQPHAQGVRWDLSSIHADADDARAGISSTLSAAAEFEQRYRDRIAALDAPALAQALRELAQLHNRFSATSEYSALRFAADSRASENADLMAAADRATVDFGNRLRFFELEWQALPEAKARTLAADPAVAADRHHLERLTDYASHMRSESDERMLAERSPAAEREWKTLFEQTVSSVSAPFDAGTGAGAVEHTVDELLSHVHDARREVRLAALETLYATLQPWSRVLAKCYDALVGDRLVTDGLRSFTTPMQDANVANDLPDGVVDDLISAVEARYGLAQRWFRAKAALLGIPCLHLADQYAPLERARPFDYSSGREIVLTAVNGFSPQARTILASAFDDNRIDAEPRAGKRGGAFCAPIAQDRKPFLLLNWTDALDDVMTLAHELGHALHFELAHAQQTPLSCDTGMAMAEVASTFNEMLVFDHLLAHEQDPATRRALISGRVEGSFATVFRQVMMARYETNAYAAKAAGLALTDERLCDLWITENQRYYGDSMDLPDGYRLGWSYIPHFIETRFYTYSYAFAHLTSLALYARFRAEGAAFIQRYLDLLAAGGSETPRHLLADAGIDIADPAWVDAGFAEMERLVTLAEESAAAVIPPAPVSP